MTVQPIGIRHSSVGKLLVVYIRRLDVSRGVTASQLVGVRVDELGSILESSESRLQNCSLINVYVNAVKILWKHQTHLS